MSIAAHTFVNCPECDEPIKLPVMLGHTVAGGGIKIYPLGVDDSLLYRHYAKAHAKAEAP